MALTISINQAAAFTVNVGVPGPTGATGPTGPVGPTGPAGAGGIWGQITGTLSSQTDLASALAGKYSTTNPAGYIDLTTAGLYFYPLTGNPNDFATQAWVIGQNYLTIGSLAGYATMSWVNGELAGYALQSWVTDRFYPLTGNPSGFLTSSALTPYLTSATAASTYQTISGMSGYAVTERGLPGGGSTNQVLVKSSSAAYDVSWSAIDLSAYATLSYVNSNFYGIDNPDGFITASALTGYLLESTAASTYAVIAAGQPISGTVGQVLTKNSGANYDSSWTTLIPGDRYLTTSSTSNTVSNGNKTFTVGTGLSYTPTQNLTIAYDVSHHMHGEVLTYNSGTGVLTVDINNHTGTGTYASWVVNVGGVTPLASVAWGSITGTLGNQTDLATALNDKLEVSTAASTYFLLAGGALNLNSHITVADTSDSDSEMAGFGFGVQKSSDHTKGTTVEFDGLDTYDGASHMNVNPTGLTFPDATTQTTSATNLGFISDAPSDGNTYGRNNGSWTVAGGGGYIGSVSYPLSVTSGNLSVDLSNYLSLGGGTLTGTLFVQTGAYLANDIEVSSSGVLAKYTSDYSQLATLTYNSLAISPGGMSPAIMYVTTTGLTFPDATTQTTAGYPNSNPNGFIGGAPSDGQTYAMQNGNWSSFSSGIGDAPYDGATYARQNGGWTSFTPFSGPSSSNAVWAYGNWYSANVTNIMDGNYQYWNVLTF